MPVQKRVKLVSSGDGSLKSFEHFMSNICFDIKFVWRIKIIFSILSSFFLLVVVTVD